eukprot:3057010-Heterocapsa_arctica.AAC.1
MVERMISNALINLRLGKLTTGSKRKAHEKVGNTRAGKREEGDKYNPLGKATGEFRLSPTP